MSKIWITQFRIKKKQKQKKTFVLSRVCYTCATWQLNQPQAIKVYHTAGFRSAIKWVKTFPQRIVHVQCTSVNCLLLINFRFVKGKAITESLQFAMKNERYQTMQQTNQKLPRGKRRDLITTERNQMPQLLAILNEWLHNLSFQFPCLSNKTPRY